MASLTSNLPLEDERHQTLHDAIVKLCLEMRLIDGPLAVFRTDPAPSFKALVNDPLLKKHRITIELGRAKTPDKNPAAERAVQELERELLRQEPLGGAVSPLILAVAWPMWAPEVEFSSFRALSRRQLTFPSCC